MSFKPVLTDDALMALYGGGQQSVPMPQMPPPVDLTPVMAAMAQQASAPQPIYMPPPQMPQVSSNNAAATAVLGLSALATLGVGIAGAAGAFDDARASIEGPADPESQKQEETAAPAQPTPEPHPPVATESQQPAATQTPDTPSFKAGDKIEFSAAGETVTGTIENVSQDGQWIFIKPNHGTLKPGWVKLDDDIKGSIKAI